MEHCVSSYAPPPPLSTFTHSSIIHLSLLFSEASHLSPLCWSMWTPPVLPEWANHWLCPLHCSYLKAWSLQSCCKGGCLDSSTTQALPACPLELSCHINTNTLHWTAKHLALSSRQAGPSYMQHYLPPQLKETVLMLYWLFIILIIN